MKKNVILLLILISIIMVGDGLSLNKEDQYINKVLKTDAYSYLSPKAQKYIAEVYKDTGELLLTEQNKEDNTPYLNPQYIEYLELSDKEKKDVEYIPDSIIVDYIPTESFGETSLPKTYDLRNVGGHNYTSDMKDQGDTGICWAFSSVEAAETLLMKKSNVSKVFSVRQLDYASATDYLISRFNDNSTINCTSPEGCGYVNYSNLDNGSRKLGSGGNFFTSSILMANGLSLFNESDFKWNEDMTGKWPGEVFNYSKSQYEVDSTIQIPSINKDTASEYEINEYVNEVKRYIYEYGGPFVGTYSPMSTCGFKNTDGKYVMKTDDCISANANLGHAMQIIGWDDNYSYAYCESGTNHNNVTNGTCSSGTYTTGKGAWIVRNSWGEHPYKYVYVTYDSTRLITAFITSMSSMSNRSWDNNYHVNPWKNQDMSNGLSGLSNQTIEFNTRNKKSEKVEKVKILSAYPNGKFTLSITSGNNTYNNIATETTEEPGFYTFDLKDKNIILTEPTFSVTISSPNDALVVKNSISVFTSNVTNSPDSYTVVGGSLKTYDEEQTNVVSTDNPAYLDAETSNVKMVLEHYTKNLPPGIQFSYRIMKGSEDYTSYFLSNWRRDNPINNYVYTRLEQRSNDITKPICGTTFTMQVLYNGNVVQSFPIKRICTINGSVRYTTSKIKLNKNDGTSSYVNQDKSDLSRYTLMNSDGSHNMSLTNQGELFKYDKHITSWNTKADGTGTTYKNNEFLLYKDMELYAQWENGHSYYIRYACKYNQCTSGSAQYGSRYGKNYGSKFTLNNNTFTNLEGKEFLHWDINGNVYYEEEEVMDLATSNSPYNLDETVDIEAVWGNNYKTISFDANGGTGSMKEIKVPTSQATRLKYNKFTRSDYRFDYWNTKPDGSGTTYTNGQLINTNSDLTLYAQWNESTNPITSITLDKNTLNLTIGNSKTINAALLPADTTDSKEITWTSSNPSVATVSNGRVTAVKAGTTTITATTSNNLSATCMVTVSEQPAYPTSIRIMESKLSLEVGASYNLVAVISPSDALNNTITWASDDTNVARVNSNGKITAVRAGSALITATTANGLMATCEIKVIDKFGFKDVPAGAWYYNSVKEAYNRGIIGGYNSTTFGPNDKITRGQLVTILWRLEGQPAVSGTSKFKDVKEGSYYTPAVKWAAANHVVNGYNATTFGPANNIIRQDLAVMLNNYAKYKNLSYLVNDESVISSFADYNRVKGRYSAPALRWAVKNRVMNGQIINGMKYISPSSNTTRAEAATMIVNFMDTFNIKK